MRRVLLGCGFVVMVPILALFLLVSHARKRFDLDTSKLPVRARSGQTFPVAMEPALGCSLGCYMSWRVSASTSRPGHDASKLYEDDTAWVSGREGCVPGDTLTFSFPPEVWPKPEGFLAKVFSNRKTRMIGFAVVPGFATDDATWRQYARPKTLEVWFRGQPYVVMELADERMTQMLEFPNIWFTDEDEFVVKITDVRCGTDPAKPVALTMLIPMGAH